MKSNDIKQLFHIISYLQYPFLLLALFFMLKPYYNFFVNSDVKSFLVNANIALVFIGIGISFSTLQDTAKTQNQFSKRIWQNPKKGKRAIVLISALTLLIFILGFLGYFINNDGALKEISLGLIVLGIGLIGLLKTALEMFDNHVKY